MIDVLLVEDELSALERIISFSFWSDGIFRIQDTARNGRDALEKINRGKPDIVVTDIEMPVMNGIELIRRIRETDTELPVIILSCHESFEYARAAVSLGVNEYILKDFMEENAVKLALSKTAPSLSVFSSRIGTAAVKPSAESEHALLRAINSGPGSSETGFEYFHGRRVSLIYIHIDGFSIDKHKPESMFEEIDWSLKEMSKQGYSGIAEYAEGGNFWVLIEEQPVSFAENFYDRLKNRSETVTIAVGELFTDLKDIAQEAASVRELFGYRVFLGCNRIILPKSAEGIGGGDPAFIRDRIEAVKTAVTECDAASCFSSLRELYDRDLPGMLKYNYVEYVNLRLLSLILSLVERGDINLRELADGDYLSLHELERKETVAEMREWFESIFSRVFELEEDDVASRISNRSILKIINIIKNRYDEDLSLDELSDEIGVHKVYLSRLFKKEVGRNYYDYLQSYRIRKSELLLGDEKLKIHEVAAKTGFKNYDQFAVVFKKINGISPSDFRKKRY